MGCEDPHLCVGRQKLTDSAVAPAPKGPGRAKGKLASRCMVGHTTGRTGHLLTALGRGAALAANTGKGITHGHVSIGVCFCTFLLTPIAVRYHSDQ
ncbi:hypothetical protein ACOMHN_037191 [Nucella lapillus]